MSRDWTRVVAQRLRTSSWGYLHCCTVARRCHAGAAVKWRDAATRVRWGDYPGAVLMSTSTSGLAISTRGLRKTYLNRKGRHVAVAGLDLDVPVGGVHGFLGPNGSGKTTTIRMLLGLIRADSGTMSIFGREVPKHLPEVVGRVGAIVESPKFFPAFSGRKNLQLLAEAIGRTAGVVDQVLEQSGLGKRGKDKYRTYSLGMKQRLAIAATLLKEPDLLVFDEPTNGLDPAGIREIRKKMR
mgnify:CR=1 FL=1